MLVAIDYTHPSAVILKPPRYYKFYLIYPSIRVHTIFCKYLSSSLNGYVCISKVNNNARLYSQLALPFVMGTTGGDRDALVAEVPSSVCIQIY